MSQVETQPVDPLVQMLIEERYQDGVRLGEARQEILRLKAELARGEKAEPGVLGVEDYWSYAQILAQMILGRTMVSGSWFVALIKSHRERTGADLKTAKNAIDRLPSIHEVRDAAFQQTAFKGRS